MDKLTFDTINASTSNIGGLLGNIIDESTPHQRVHITKIQEQVDALWQYAQDRRNGKQPS